MSKRAFLWFLGILTVSVFFQLANLVVILITGHKLFDFWANIIAIATNAGCAVWLTINAIAFWKDSVKSEKEAKERFSALNEITHDEWARMGLPPYKPFDYRKSRHTIATLNAAGVVCNIAAVIINIL